MNAPHPLLQVEKLNITLAGQPLVRQVSYQLQAGQTMGVVGESGSGKTLSALAIMGLLPEELTPTAQTLQFDGQALQSLKPRQWRKLCGPEMAMIFQEPMSALNPVKTIGWQVAEVIRIHQPSLTRDQVHQQVMQALVDVQLPEAEHIARRYPHQLSGGQRQRAMIAMALALRPKLLIADEPTTALDVTVQGEILSLIQQRQQQLNMAVLFITHDFGLVRRMADHVLVMQHGQVVEQGAVHNILNKPQQPDTQRLLAAMPSLNTKRKAVVKGKVLLDIADLSKQFTQDGGLLRRGKVTNALQQVSFQLREQEVVGVVGESGSGKSTLARCITRLVEPDRGAVVLQGQDVLELSPRKLRLARRQMQMVFQDPASSLNPRMTVAESIAEGLRAHGVGNKAERYAEVERLLQACGLPADAATRYPHQFSGGQRQRIGLARALALKPKLIIADEAVSALDVSVQQQVLALMMQLKKEFGVSYLFISHDLRVVSHVADRVLVMRYGEVVEHGPAHQVFTKPQHPYTQQLLQALPV